MSIINEDKPITQKVGDTARGFEIEEPNMDVTGATVTVRVRTRFGRKPVTPHDGIEITPIKAANPAIFKYVPAAGTTYPEGEVVGYFHAAFTDDRTDSSSEVLIQVDPA